MTNKRKLDCNLFCDHICTSNPIITHPIASWAPLHQKKEFFGQLWGYSKCLGVWTDMPCLLVKPIGNTNSRNGDAQSEAGDR